MNCRVDHFAPRIEPAKLHPPFGAGSRLLGGAAWLAATAIYAGVLVALPVVALAGRLMRLLRGNRSKDGGRHLVVVGTFYSRNWAKSHLRPLAEVCSSGRVTAVVDGPTVALDRVHYIRPPQWAQSGWSRAWCKSFLTIREMWRSRPDLVMGYHLLPCGLIALLAGRLFGVPAAYQLTGGPTELIGGGAISENCLLKRLGRTSKTLEFLAIRLAGKFDLLVVRGDNARQFLLAHSIIRPIRIIPGSLEPEKLQGAAQMRDIDVISVGRLVPIKQPERLVSVLSKLSETRSDFRAVILGDGPLREGVREAARACGIDDRLELVGHVDDVQPYLRRAKVFILTSRSEGLSIAMAEAMAAGVVPVVAAVGELGELVVDGETGYCVPAGNLDEQAARIDAILSDPVLFERLSQAARRAAVEYNGVAAVAQRWAGALSELCGVDCGAGALRPIGGSGWRRKVWERTPRRLRSILGSAIGRLGPERLLGRRFRQWLAVVDRLQREGAEIHRDYQWQHLRRILRLAEQHSPYYRQLFEQVGLRAADVQQPQDLHRLPTLDAEIVRARGNDIRLTGRAGTLADYISTGGSGGRPLHFYIDRDRSAFEYAHLVASWQRAGFTLDMQQAIFRGSAVGRQRHGLIHEHDPVLRRHYYSTYHLTDAAIRQYLRHIATIGDCFLQGYPSAISTLARCILRNNLAVPPNIRGVLAGSENVFAQQRESIERAFGVPVFSWYGQSEKVVLAAECEHSTDYHVWPTYGYFELLDEEGLPVTTPGRRGEIVGSSFVNTVMPFIRYRTGDYATYVGACCELCGRYGPVIRDVQGHREQEMLVARDGTLISWTALNMHDRTFESVRQFQFEQRHAGEATLHVVPSDGFCEENRQRIERAIRRKLNGQLRVQVQLAEKVEQSPRGKIGYVQQHLDIPGTEQRRTS